jgi:CDP-diacylglycerol---glycerol-3-phosphate 3-phosphatidyltransferase
VEEKEFNASEDNLEKPTEKPTDKTSEKTAVDELTFNTTPNQLTLFRMACVPIIVGFLYFGTTFWDLMATLVFIVASITDYFDGYIARSRNLMTIYGKLLDPLADKFLVVSSLIMLQEVGRIHAVVVILLICRELAITGLRALASAEGVIIPASASAKWKTASQMVAIPMIMIGVSFWGIPLLEIGLGLLYISLGISLWSAKDYIVDFFVAIGKKHRERKERRLAMKKGKQDL